MKTYAESGINKSWVFQNIKGGRRDPILDRGNAFVHFVICNDVDETYDCVVCPPYQIKELKFCDPKITRPDLIGKKKVVYRKDLPCFTKIMKYKDIEDQWK